jgi:hypothetical protein
MSRVPRRILLGHLAAFGDCLCASAVARQIKHDFPDAHLTWAIGKPYRSIAEGNPSVDSIWEVPLPNREAIATGWGGFIREAHRRRRHGEFDLLFFTQVPPANYKNFDGTVRASIFNGYPHPITVPVAPVVRLSEEEVEHVKTFALQHGLAQYRRVVLFECAALSGQSFVTPDFALETARRVLQRMDDTAFVLSSSTVISTPHPHIIDGSGLRFKENAELTRYATLFVGCSSGISWLSTSDWAQRLPMIQLLRRATSVFASFCHDAEHFGLPSEHIIEMTDCTPEHLAGCIEAALRSPFSEARARYHENIPVDHRYYFNTFILSLLKSGRFLTASRSIGRVIRRYGFRAIPRTLVKTFDTL